MLAEYDQDHSMGLRILDALLQSSRAYLRYASNNITSLTLHHKNQQTVVAWCLLTRIHEIDK